MQVESPDGGEPVIETEEHPAEIPPDEAALEAAAITDTSGKKAVMVPLPELISERKERQALKRESDDLKAKVADLEARATRGQALETEIGHLRTQIDALKPKAPEQPEIADDEAEDTAKDLGLYTTEGKPDLAAARRVIKREAARIDSKVTTAVEAAVKPVRQMNVDQQAAALTNAAMAKAREGYCKPETLEKLIAQYPPELRANPQTMNLALVLARGIDGGGTKPADVSEVLVTEPAGGRRIAPGPLSDLEKKAAKVVGMTDEAWKNATKDYTPGQSARLE
jgi:hypothetical protein